MGLRNYENWKGGVTMSPRQWGSQGSPVLSSFTEPLAAHANKALVHLALFQSLQPLFSLGGKFALPLNQEEARLSLDWKLELPLTTSIV